MKREELKKAYRVNAFICAAMVASTFCYAVVVEMLKSQYAPFSGFVEPKPPMQVMRLALFAVSAAIFVVIKYLWQLFLQGKLKLPNAQYAQHGYVSVGPVGPFMTASLISYALCEAICIFGLVLFLIGGQSSDFYLFFAISLVAYAAYFPRYAKLEQWARAQGLIEEEHGRRHLEFE